MLYNFFHFEKIPRELSICTEIMLKISAACGGRWRVGPLITLTLAGLALLHVSYSSPGQVEAQESK